MSSPGKATVTRENYRAYINSAAWRATRERYWNSKLSKECWVCDAPRSKGMHLHHRTYKNLGNERLMDLVPVCPACHDLIHEIAAARGNRLSNLWKATTIARRRHNPRFGTNAVKARAARTTRKA
ncbi:HNH endonuclease signature motif containing protein [Microbacterium sp. LWH10-1.2]|uniref:HNH endonuclease signature motif containing protein n=1 Tax=Microbacterium sp. LWH10-1.2 TaxID=3135255 RepID=UPI00313989CC